MKLKASGYLEKIRDSEDIFIHSIRDAYQKGRLDHNYIRKTIIDRVKCSGDENAIILGSLLLQLDNSEIYDFLKSNRIE